MVKGSPHAVGHRFNILHLWIGLFLETTRAPRLAERRVLQPLAVFGLLHGMHEWIEILLLQGVWLGVPFPEYLDWIRYALLVISFVPLVYFGLLMLVGPEKGARVPLAILIGIMIVYAILLIVVTNQRPDLLLKPSDTLARYTLAVPGGILAGLGLRKRAQQVDREGRGKLARRFRWAAVGFAWDRSTCTQRISSIQQCSLILLDSLFNWYGQAWPHW